MVGSAIPFELSLQLSPSPTALAATHSGVDPITVHTVQFSRAMDETVTPANSVWLVTGDMDVKPVTGQAWDDSTHLDLIIGGGGTVAQHMISLLTESASLRALDGAMCNPFANLESL